MLLLTLPILAYLSYKYQIIESNRNMGYIDFQLDFFGIIIFGIWIALTIAIYPNRLARPSDLFLMFYTLVVFIWDSLFWQATGYLTEWSVIILLIITVVPPLTFVLLRRTLKLCTSSIRLNRILYSDIHPHGLLNSKLFSYLKLFSLSRRYLIPVMILFLGVSSVIAYSQMGTGSFDWNSMYIRRLAGREVFGERTFQAYIFTMTINSVAPLLGFIGGYRKSIVSFLFSIAMTILAFWLLGLKAPFFYVCIFTFVGYLIRIGKLMKFPTYLLILVIGVFFSGLIEMLFVEVSFITETLTRRIAVVGPEVQSFYVDMLVHENDISSWLLGIPLDNSADITFKVGSEYFSNDATNANTNAFLYAFAKFGIFGFFYTILLVSIFFIILDELYIKYLYPEYWALSGIYALLICEQAFSTALISSGVLFCLILLMIFSNEKSNMVYQSKGVIK